MKRILWGFLAAGLVLAGCQQGAGGGTAAVNTPVANVPGGAETAAGGNAPEPESAPTASNAAAAPAASNAATGGSTTPSAPTSGTTTARKRNYSGTWKMEVTADSEARAKQVIEMAGEAAKAQGRTPAEIEQAKKEAEANIREVLEGSRLVIRDDGTYTLMAAGRAINGRYVEEGPMLTFRNPDPNQPEFRLTVKDAGKLLEGVDGGETVRFVRE